MRLELLPAATVARLGGIPIRLDPTFAAVPIGLILNARWLSLVENFSYERLAATLAGLVLGIAGVFLSVLLHELGHAVAARRFGLATREIRIGGFYGLAIIAGTAAGRWRKIAILAAGPLVNALSALWLWAVLGFPAIDSWLGLRSPLERTLVYDWPVIHAVARSMFYLNVGMTIFNLLPAFPLDGGRITRLLLPCSTGERRAVRTVAALGVFVGLWSCLGSMRYGTTVTLVGMYLLFFNLWVLQGLIAAPED